MRTVQSTTTLLHSHPLRCRYRHLPHPPSLLWAPTSPACIVRDEGARVHHRNQGVQLQPVHHGVPRSHRLGKLVADVLRLRNPAVLKDDPEEENATIKQSRGARAQSACW